MNSILLEAESETTTSQNGQAELQKELGDLQTELDIARENFADIPRARKLELDDLNRQLRKKQILSLLFH
ncbi:hypothetical protein DID88_003378 [Monilinia fructigena]|uniref:Uncharacterized protein n=1 Tax=Monilinia fructigena TaxID=38457 RepID=A0A395IUB4_9HELO|nr:hypothetical protein DID88_003378 [Monilinia fructigena]